MKFLNKKNEEVKISDDYKQYIDLLDTKFLEIKKDLLETIVHLKENGADKLAVEWQIIKKLRSYGLPIKLNEFKRKHAELYQ